MIKKILASLQKNSTKALHFVAWPCCRAYFPVTEHVPFWRVPMGAVGNEKAPPCGRPSSYWACIEVASRACGGCECLRRRGTVLVQ